MTSDEKETNQKQETPKKRLTMDRYSVVIPSGPDEKNPKRRISLVIPATVG